MIHDGTLLHYCCFEHYVLTTVEVDQLLNLPLAAQPTSQEYTLRSFDQAPPPFLTGCNLVVLSAWEPSSFSRCCGRRAKVITAH